MEDTLGFDQNQAEKPQEPVLEHLGSTSAQVETERAVEILVAFGTF